MPGIYQKGVGVYPSLAVSPMTKEEIIKYHQERLESCQPEASRGPKLFPVFESLSTPIQYKSLPKHEDQERRIM